MYVYNEILFSFKIKDAGPVFNHNINEIRRLNTKESKTETKLKQITTKIHVKKPKRMNKQIN